MDPLPQAPVPTPQALEADDTGDAASIEDTDSVFGTGSLRSSATSFREDMMKSREEHGRKYHGYMDANFQSHLAWLSLGKRQTFAPFKKIQRALDIGCGTGLWAIDFADAHPEAQVLGVDLASVMPFFVPPNLQFEVDDLEKEWNFSQKFDYIHSQLMIGAFQDWPRLFRQAYENMNPGGYLEIHDIDFLLKCDDASLPPNCDLMKWQNLMHEGASMAGFPLDAISKVPDMMRSAGFEAVVATPIKWPINTWPKDKHHKEIGLWTMENFTWGCQSMSLALFTRALGWTAEEVEVFMAGVRRDLRTRRYHAYWNFWVIYGKKPAGQGETEAP